MGEQGLMFNIDILLSSGQKVIYQTGLSGRERLEGWLASNADENEFYVSRSVGVTSVAYFIRRRDVSAVEIHEVSPDSRSSQIGFMTHR